jgi:hypothetical protein
MPKYRKRPVVIEAIPYEEGGEEAVEAFVGKKLRREKTGVWIPTLEGDMYAHPGRDWIIRGVRGECYPIKADIFEETYDKMPELCSVCGHGPSDHGMFGCFVGADDPGHGALCECTLTREQFSN